jgi:hypothetical protein
VRPPAARTPLAATTHTPDTARKGRSRDETEVGGEGGEDYHNEAAINARGENQLANAAHGAREKAPPSKRIQIPLRGARQGASFGWH